MSLFYFAKDIIPYQVIFVSNGMYELLQSHVHAIHEHFSTIFGAEYDVILTGIHDIVV